MPADNPGVLQVVDLVADIILHVHFFKIAHHHDTRISLVFIGKDQLVDNDEHLLRPAQDNGVPLFNDTRATLAQFFNPVFNPAGQNTNQGADDEYTGQCHNKHGNPEPPANIRTHGTGIQGTHQAQPECFKKGHRLGIVHRDFKKTDNCSHNADENK